MTTLIRDVDTAYRPVEAAQPACQNMNVVAADTAQP